MESSLLVSLIALLAVAFGCNTRDSHNLHHSSSYGRGGYYEPYFNYHSGYHGGYYGYRRWGYSGSWSHPFLRYAARNEDPLSAVERALASASEPEPLHPESWSDVNCTYAPMNATLAWIDARTDCAKRGAQLAVLANREAVARVLLNMATDFGVDSATDGIWIGASDNANEAKWGWVDGKLVQFSDWMLSRPDGEKEQNCAVLKRNVDGPVGDGFWDDEDCDIKKPYLCQKC